MLTSIQSGGVAPEVNLKTSAQARKHANEKSTLALNPRADITKSPNQGYISGPTKRTCVLQKKQKETTMVVTDISMNLVILLALDLVSHCFQQYPKIDGKLT